MMQIKVSGAGAGKTTGMAKELINYHIPEGKIVFCMAFTNAAVDCIKERIIKQLGYLPENIKIFTIHSFLYQELVKPFYFFLYGKQFDQLSTIQLSTNPSYANDKVKELEENNILHITEIPKKAKWVVFRKSTDTKREKEVRRNIINVFSSYCAAIFIDEAQDIDKDMEHVLQALDRLNIEIHLFGDPKQDLKGHGCFQHLIRETTGTQYMKLCYRCPQKHLNLSNQLASHEEQQVAASTNKEGSIDVVYESDYSNMKEFISNGKYDLAYISKKNDRYETHRLEDENKQFQALDYEVFKAMNKKWSENTSEKEINRAAFHVTEMMLREYNGNNEEKIIRIYRQQKAFDNLSKREFASMISAFSEPKNMREAVPIVSSIENIKGQEGNSCLFILTSDLAPYLFGEKTENNKTKHLVYVALTRSKEKLTFLITKEVETKYGRVKLDLLKR